jgi:hypothetical protein
MNQYIQEQSILYVSKLKRERLMDGERKQEDEAPATVHPHRWFYRLAQIVRRLRFALSGNAPYSERRRGEGWY